jgi:hypothetical protein
MDRNEMRLWFGWLKPRPWNKKLKKIFHPLLLLVTIVRFTNFGLFSLIGPEPDQNLEPEADQNFDPQPEPWWYK